MASDAGPDVAEFSLCWGDAQLRLPGCTLAFVVGEAATGAVVPPEVVPPEVVPPEVVPPEEVPALDDEELLEAELEVDVPFDG